MLGLTFVQAATAVALAGVDDGDPITARAAYRRALERWRRLLASVLVASAIVAVLDLTIIGIPLAIWLVVRRSLLAQVVMLDGTASPRPLRRSAALVGGRWWRVAVFTTLVTGSGLLPGPVVGGLLLLGTDAAFNVVNLIAGASTR